MEMVPGLLDNGTLGRLPEKAAFHSAATALARRMKSVLTRLLEDVDAYMASTAGPQAPSLARRFREHPVLHVVHHRYPTRPWWQRTADHRIAHMAPNLNASLQSGLHGFHIDDFWATMQFQPTFGPDSRSADRKDIKEPNPLDWFEESTLAVHADGSVHRMPQLGVSDLAIWFGKYVGRVTQNRVLPSMHGVFLPILYRRRWNHDSFVRKSWLVHAWPSESSFKNDPDDILGPVPCMSFCGKPAGAGGKTYGIRVNIDVSSPSSPA